MLDIKNIREDPDKVKLAMKNRNSNLDSEIDELLDIDQKRRDLISETDNLKAKQNIVSKKIPDLKKSGETEEVSKLLKEMKEISNKISTMRSDISDLEKRQRDLLLSIPNIPHESVPIGKDDNDNKVIRYFGKPTEFSFTPKPHWELGKDLGILDPERASKVTGSRFHFYKGLGAKLERAIINFFLDTHAKSGYTEILPPFIVNRASMLGTGQLPKFEEDAFNISKYDFFLIPTAEVPVTNMHRDEILKEEDLPLKYCAYSACFRAEAGSAGRDTRGLIRQHQFNKVELVKFVKPEDSYEELEQLTLDAQKVLKLLNLPHRVVALSTGDLGFSSAKTYDIEVWMPSYNRYVEISSCSNFEDFQSRRASIRYKDASGKTRLVHTLNGSGVAIGRTVAAILENFQTEKGEINLPEILKGCI